jgi:hypothetical protein
MPFPAKFDRSDLKGAGTDADVHVVVYGEKGDTGERLLDNAMQNNFERGKVGGSIMWSNSCGVLH